VNEAELLYIPMDTLIEYHGQVDNAIVRSLLKQMDDRMEERSEKRMFMKKVNSILIECLQNLIHHGVKVDGNQNQPVILVKRENDHYYITTGNLIEAAKLPKLKGYIDKLNSMNEEELRDYYKEILTNGRFNPKGGGGLGIINIARKAEANKIFYEFSTVNDHLLFFYMHFQVVSNS
jgi:hypothetical protein